MSRHSSDLTTDLMIDVVLRFAGESVHAMPGAKVLGGLSQVRHLFFSLALRCS